MQLCLHLILILFFLFLQGPNFLWAADGYEKLAQPYGLYIYGLIDTFSRKMLCLKVLPNKKAETVSNWVMNYVTANGMLIGMHHGSREKVA